MSKYALRISHYLLEKDRAVEYFIPFTPKALVSLLDGEYGDAMGEIFSLNKEDLKELLEKSDGTLATFLKRHNLFNLKDENGENYFVELLDKDNQGDVWIINDPEEPEENSLGDYLADAKLISDTVDTVGFLEFGRYIEGSKSVSDINEEAENTMMFRVQFFLEKVIFSIIVAIDESDDWNTIEWPVPPKNFLEYINSFFPDIKNNSEGGNVRKSLDEIFELAENSFSVKIVDIERFTESFLRLEIPNISYSLYAASYDYIYKVFEILIGNRKDLLTDNLVEYIDKIHINLWEVSRHKPFWFIKLMNIRVGTDIIIKGLLNANWSLFFIKILPKGLIGIERIRSIVEKPSKIWESWFINKCKVDCFDKVFDNIIKTYSKEGGSRCFGIAIEEDKEKNNYKNYIALSGFDYKGSLLNNVDIEKFSSIIEATVNIIKEKNKLDGKYCYLYDLTRSYTDILTEKITYITKSPGYRYFKEDYSFFNDEGKRKKFKGAFSCFERKILGHMLLEEQESTNHKIVFFSRWAPCEKCRPAIFALENNCYYAYADSYKNNLGNNLENDVKYNLSRYYVKENPNEVNEKKYEIIKEELKKDYIDGSNKIRSQKNGCAADNDVKLQENNPDIKIYDDQYQNFKLYSFIYEGKESGLEYLIQIKNYLVEPKYRYIQIGIDEKEGVSIFCDKEEGKAFIGLKYVFLSKLGIKNVYDGNIYYWGERSTEELLKEELLRNFQDLQKTSENALYQQSNRILGEVVCVDVTRIVDVYISPEYDESKYLVLRQSFGGDEESTIESIVFNACIKDIDISMCKYGMDRLSKVKEVILCSNDNRDILVKIIEACRIDKILNEIESRRQPGSEIEKERRKLRNSIEKTIYGINGSECEFDGINIHII